MQLGGFETVEDSDVVPRFLLLVHLSESHATHKVSDKRLRLDMIKIKPGLSKHLICSF
jgi:hypothetical protein